MGETTNQQGEDVKTAGPSPQQAVTQTSEGAGQTSAEPQTFTQEQVEELAAKAVSDALAKAGREAKTLETLKADIENREKAIKEAESKRQREEEERELRELEEATKEDPDVKPTLIAYKKKLGDEKRALIAEKAEVARMKAEVEADKTAYSERFKKAEETEFEAEVFAVATKYKVDAALLMDKVMRMEKKSGAKLRDKESIDELASDMPKKADIPTPDSGKGTGGGKDLSGMSPMALARQAYSEKK